MAEDIRKRAELLLQAKQRLEAGVQKESSLGQKVADVISTPKRGIRGLAVGAAEIGLGGIGPGVAQAGLTPAQQQSLQALNIEQRQPLEAATRAVSPEFTPKNLDEKVAAGLAELGFDIGAASAISAPAGAGFLTQLVRGSLAGGAASALTQSTAKGDIKISDLALGASLGTVIPVIGPTAAGIGRVTRGLARLIASGSRTFSVEAVRAVEKMARLFDEATGSPQVISNIIKNAQRKTHQVLEKTGELLNLTRAKIGLDSYIDDGLAVLRPGYTPANADELLDVFQTLKSPTAAKDTGTLRQLLRLRKKAKELVSFRQLRSREGFELKPLSKSTSKIFDDKQGFKKFMTNLDETIRGVPGGNAQLRINKLYSRIKTKTDNLLKKIADPDQAPKFLKSLLEGDLGEAIELDEGTLQLLKWLERQKGIGFSLKQLQKEFTVKALKESTVTGPIGLLGAALRPGAQAELLRRGEQIQQGLEAAGRGLEQPLSKGAITTLGQKALEGEK